MDHLNLPISKRSPRHWGLLDLVSAAFFAIVFIFLRLAFTPLGDFMAKSGCQALLFSTSNPGQRHRLAMLVELGTQLVTIEACFIDSVDHMPCEDPKRNNQLICKTLFLLFWVFIFLMLVFTPLGDFMAASGRQALLLSTSDPGQRHRLVVLVELGTQLVTIEACFVDSVDHMPCEEPKRNNQLICKTLFLLFWVFIFLLLVFTPLGDFMAASGRQALLRSRSAPSSRSVGGAGDSVGHHRGLLCKLNRPHAM